MHLHPTPLNPHLLTNWRLLLVVACLVSIGVFLIGFLGSLQIAELVNQWP